MEVPFLPLIFILSAALAFFLFPYSPSRKLPPSPPSLPLLGNLFWLRRNFKFRDMQPFVRKLRAHYGPIFTLRIGTTPVIFILDHSLAHKSLVEHGAAFADRPMPLPAAGFLSCSIQNISSASYGPHWRVLRRNLTSEVLNPSRVRLFSDGRCWALEVLERELRTRMQAGDGVVEPRVCFQFALFSLFVFMCFGEKLDEKDVKEIEKAQRDFLLSTVTLDILGLFPFIPKFLLRQKLSTAMALRARQTEIFTPLINARMNFREEKQVERQENDRFVYSYVDSLLRVNLSDEMGRKLTSDELVMLCSEFLTAGTDTTSTALQWIMAELVKNQEIQQKLREEIDKVVSAEEMVVKEDDLQHISYLKAVVMEGLRLHPPGPALLPHSVTEEMEFEGYLIPKNTIINFWVGEMGRSEQIWKDPMEFRPERFMAGGEGEMLDLTGSREIKMIPFGAGRRICPGIGLATLHLEYFVANLVKRFEWRKVEGEEVDLTENLEFTTVMKYPLRTRLASGVDDVKGILDLGDQNILF